MNGIKKFGLGVMCVVIAGLGGVAQAQQIGTAQAIGGDDMGRVSAAATTFGVIATAVIVADSDNDPELDPEIAQTTLSELLDSAAFPAANVDRSSISQSVLDMTIAELLADPETRALVESVIAREQTGLLVDTIVNFPGQMAADLLATAQMPAGTGS